MEEHPQTVIRRSINSLTDLALGAVARIDPLGRKIARACGLQSSSYPRVVAIANVFRDRFERTDGYHSAALPDSWGYTADPAEQARHRLAIELLDSVRNGKRFGRVLEIACAEGVFTEMLAPLCDSLLAVDFSEIFLERARQRLAGTDKVSFNLWNLRSDPIPGIFDLLVVMDVLTHIRRPRKLRDVFDKLVTAMRSGDLMLVGDYRGAPEMRALEQSQLARHLLVGAKWIIGALSANPALETLKTASTDSHMFSLFRKL